MRACALAALVAVLFAEPAPAAEPPKDVLVKRVNRAIDDGVQYLKSRAEGRDDWEGLEPNSQANPGGWTSLVLLALLNAGVPPDDPVIQRGLKSLRRIESDHTYVVGLQTMVFALARQPEDVPRMQRNVDWLLGKRFFTGKQFRGWGYGIPGANGRPDGSNSQYALLGLHEAFQAGIDIKAETWEAIRNYYVATQNRDGGWQYLPGVGGLASSRTMTTAGLCGLLITSMDLRRSRQVCTPDKCGVYEEDPQIARALDWLGRNFVAGPELARVEQQHLYYYLYGLERAGRLSGQRFFGDHDWYRAGCQFLVDAQKPDGSWVGVGPEAPMRLVTTSFAVLFLSKGRTPVLISKLAWGPPDNADWNNDRNDARHLTEFCSRELFKRAPLAWQVFDTRQMGDLNDEAIRDLAGELLQSPIVYLSGHRSPRLTGAERKLLKEYLANGGFLYAEACCGSKEFDGGFRDLIREIMQDIYGEDRPLRPLPPEHPLWIASGKFESLSARLPLEGVEVGCKTVVVYSRDNSLCCQWEVNQFGDGRGRDAFRLGANIVAYATGMEPPRPRGHHVEVARDDGPRKPPRGALQAAQLRHDGDWQPAPRAMRRLMAEVSHDGIDVALKTEPVRLIDESLLDFKFLYLHGRNGFRYDKADLANLRYNLEKGGGTLLADACCGSKAFDQAFRQFAADLFPGKKLEVIPLTDELYGKDVNGAAITEVRCRREKDGKPEAEMRQVPPHLEGIQVDGRWVLVYSKYDLGCALEKHRSPDCLGHDHDSALRLARAVVLYAMKR